MRFFELSALAAAVAFHGAAAQAPAVYGNSVTAATTTYYTTLTVIRIETTVTATRNGTTATYESMMTETSAVAYPTTASAAATIPGYGNSTNYGTGSIPSATYVPPASPGAAGKVGVEALGVAALAGIVGLLVL